MSKNQVLPDHLERVNPEFIGITEKYAKIKRERQETDRRKHSLENNLNYFERTKESIDSKLKTKK